MGRRALMIKEEESYTSCVEETSYLRVVVRRLLTV